MSIYLPSPPFACSTVSLGRDLKKYNIVIEATYVNKVSSQVNRCKWVKISLQIN